MVSELEARYRERSLWLDGYPGSLTPRPAIPGDVECDVVVVGAGFTGLWTAYYLKTHQPDLRVIVVEREIAGYGPSGRNGGWVSAGVAGSAAAYGLAEDEPGDDPRPRSPPRRRSTRSAALLAAEGIDCGLLKGGSVMVATSEPQRERLSGYSGRDRARRRRDRRAREDPRRAGLVVLGARRPRRPRPAGARPRRGVRAAGRHDLREHRRPRARASGFVRCAGGTVRADVVLGATESYTTQLPPERLRYLPLYSLMIATEPLPESVWDELGWRDKGLLVGDLHHLFFYAQRTTDDRIAIGGRGAPYELKNPISENNERSEPVKRRLLGALERHFPAAAGAAITHHWGGPLAVPRDWSMSVAFDRVARLRPRRRVHRPRRGGRQRLGPHHGRPRARARNRPGHDALGRPPQPPLGARTAALPRLAHHDPAYCTTRTSPRTRRGAGRTGRDCSRRSCRPH